MTANAISGKCTIRREDGAVQVYFAATEFFDPGLALAPGRSKSPESAAAWSLLAWALRRCRALDALPERAVDSRGKPYFPSRPDIRFSLSHTRSYVLCALGGSECGADVQLISGRDAPFAEKLMDERERADFTLHELWCLREAVYKLTGEGSLRAMRFRRSGGVIIPPFDGAACRLYDCIPGCACALAAWDASELPDALREVPVREIQKSVVIPAPD